MLKIKVSRYYWRRARAVAEISCLLAVCLMTAMFNMGPMHMPEPGINPELQDYVDRFEKYARYYYGKDYVLPEMDIDIGPIVNFSSVPGMMVVGWCMRTPTPKIMINEIIMWSFSDSDLEQLMFHELGHCVLNRGHRDTHTPLMIPVSLMSSRMIETRVYEQYRDYYIYELFTFEAEKHGNLIETEKRFVQCRNERECELWR